MNRLNDISRMLQLCKLNPEAVYSTMMKSNPQFVQFINSNKDKSIEQIAKENGISPDLIKQLINR